MSSKRSRVHPKYKTRHRVGNALAHTDQELSTRWMDSQPWP
jgi:hypothetical protein